MLPVVQPHQLRETRSPAQGQIQSCAPQLEKAAVPILVEGSRPIGPGFEQFLAPRGMRVPAIHLLLLVLVSQHGLKRATVQVQVKHI